MHQIISGETHKEKIISIKNRNSIDNFLKRDSLNFSNIFNAKNCLYDSFTINNPVFNYINENYDSHTDTILKNLIRNEFDECEKIYPYLGDFFILSYHNHLKSKKFKSFLFRKNNIKYFINTLENNMSKQIAKKIFDKFSLEYVANLEYKKNNQVIIEKNNKIFVNADLEFDYLQNSKFEIKDYNFVLIEGIIESISEIHHMLHNASQNKEDYVVFCLGTSEEVKQTIIKNNSLGITKIHVVALSSTEENLNILNDISVLHNNADVISASKGQTISQEIRKGLSKGLSIKFEKTGMFITPLCEENIILDHRNFLKKRIEETENETNKNILIKRLRKFQSKKINIYLPEVFKKDVALVREINYILTFFTFINYQMCKVKLNNKILFIPAGFVKKLENKLNNTKKIINNLDKIIVLNQKEVNYVKK